MKCQNPKLICYNGCVFCFIPRSFVYLRMRMPTSKQHCDMNCGSAFDPGASGLHCYCTSTCARSGCTRRASCVDSRPKEKKNRASLLLYLQLCDTAILESLRSADTPTAQAHCRAGCMRITVSPAGVRLPKHGPAVETVRSYGPFRGLSGDLVWWRMGRRGWNGQTVHHACVYAWASSLHGGRVHLPARCVQPTLCRGGLARSTTDLDTTSALDDKFGEYHRHNDKLCWPVAAESEGSAAADAFLAVLSDFLTAIPTHPCLPIYPSCIAHPIRPQNALDHSPCLANCAPHRITTHHKTSNPIHTGRSYFTLSLFAFPHPITSHSPTVQITRLFAVRACLLVGCYSGFLA